MSATNLEIHAAGQVNTVPGVPVFIWQTGEWAAAITDTGVGDVTLTFNASNGIDAAEAVWKCTIIAVAARITIPSIISRHHGALPHRQRSDRRGGGCALHGHVGAATSSDGHILPPKHRKGDQNEGKRKRS